MPERKLLIFPISASGANFNPQNTPCISAVKICVPFGPLPEEYSYRCSQCQHEMKVNQAIIDFENGMAEFAGTYYEGFMPIVGCPNCNQETMEYVKA